MPVSMELTMSQRKAVTRKKALTYRSANRAGKSGNLERISGVDGLASRLCASGAARSDENQNS
jgi:hypothetical protein